MNNFEQGEKIHKVNRPLIYTLSANFALWAAIIYTVVKIV